MQKKIAKVVKYLSKAIDMLDPFDGESEETCLWQETAMLWQKISTQDERIAILEKQIYNLTHPAVYSTPSYDWQAAGATMTTGCSRPADENKELDL